MIRPLFASAALLAFTFALVIGALHAQPPDNPALNALTDCHAPCWQGLKIGTSSADEAVARINVVGGMNVSQTQCYISDFCVMYSWRSAQTQALYAFVEVNYGRIAAIDAVNPGFSVGQVLLALNDLSVNGGDLDAGVQNQFHVNLHVAGSALILTTVTPCPGSYRDLLDSPVRVLELEAPDGNGQFPHPLLTFPAFHRAFNRICGRLQ